MPTGVVAQIEQRVRERARAAGRHARRAASRSGSAVVGVPKPIENTLVTRSGSTTRRADRRRSADDAHVVGVRQHARFAADRAESGCTRRRPLRRCPRPRSRTPSRPCSRRCATLLPLKAVVNERRRVDGPRDVDPADDAVDRRRPPSRRGSRFPGHRPYPASITIAAVSRQRQMAPSRSRRRPASAAVARRSRRWAAPRVPTQTAVVRAAPR